MKRNPVLCLLLVLSLGVRLHAHAQDTDVLLTARDLAFGRMDNSLLRIPGSVLFMQARYHAGDDPAWANPAFDDRNWELVNTWLSPKHLPQQGWPGIGWFRVSVKVDTSLREQALGYVINHNGAVEVYVDGNLAYSSGTVGATPDEEEAFRDFEPFVLPLVAGQHHGLAIRYSNTTLKGYRTKWNGTGFLCWWGDLTTLKAYRKTSRFNMVVESKEGEGAAIVITLPTSREDV